MRHCSSEGRIISHMLKIKNPFPPPPKKMNKTHICLFNSIWNCIIIAQVENWRGRYCADSMQLNLGFIFIRCYPRLDQLAALPRVSPGIHFMTNKLELVRVKIIEKLNRWEQRKKRGSSISWIVQLLVSCFVKYICNPSIQWLCRCYVVVAIILGDYGTARTKIKDTRHQGSSLKIPSHVAKGRVRIRSDTESGLHIS